MSWDIRYLPETIAILSPVSLRRSVFCQLGLM